MRLALVEAGLQRAGLVPADQGEKWHHSSFSGRASRCSMAFSTEIAPPASRATIEASGRSSPCASAIRASASAVAAPSTVTVASKASPAPSARPKRKFRDCVRGAGQHQIAQTREARQRLAPRAQMHGQPRHLGKAARHHRGPGAVAQTRADRRPRRNRHDVLQRPAQLGPDDIRRPVKPQHRCGQRLLQRRPGIGIVAGQRQRRRQTPRDVGGKRGSGQHRQHRPGEAAAIRAEGPRSVSRSIPFAVPPAAAVQRRPVLGQKSAQLLRRQRQQQCLGAQRRPADRPCTRTAPGSATPGSRGLLRPASRSPRPERHLAPWPPAPSPAPCRRRPRPNTPIMPWPPFLPAAEHRRRAASSGQRGRAARSIPSRAPSREPLDPGPGDHRAVVGAKPQRRRQEPRARPRAATRLQRRADLRVRGHAAGDRTRHRHRARRHSGSARRDFSASTSATAAWNRRTDRRRSRSRQAALLRDQRVALAQHRGLEAREAHVAAGAVQQRARQGKARGIPSRAAASTAGPPGCGRPAAWPSCRMPRPARRRWCRRGG